MQTPYIRTNDKQIRLNKQKPTTRYFNALTLVTVVMSFPSKYFHPLFVNKFYISHI